jgi:hypothetical protein
MTAAELNPEFRFLIDARLDAIERVLIGAQVSYSERRHIVSEVETQVFELLARRGDNPTRDDVEAVLASLDPPESYVPEELRGRVAAASARPAVPEPPPGPRISRLALASAAATTLVLPIGLLAVATSHNRDVGEIAAVFGFAMFAVTLCGIAAVVRIVRSEGRLIGLPPALFAAAVGPLVLLNVGVISLAVLSQGVIPWIVTGAGVAYLNYLGIRRLRLWLIARRGAIEETLRTSAADWFVAKDTMHPI